MQTATIQVQHTTVTLAYNPTNGVGTFELHGVLHTVATENICEAINLTIYVVNHEEELSCN